MIFLSVLEDAQLKEKLFIQNNIPINENSSCVTAKEKEQILGYCLFDIDKEKIVIRYITPENDLGLADGILRSTLHVAAERFIMNAYYEKEEMTSFFNALNFIKNVEEKSLNMDKLFTSCQSCK